MSGSGEAMTDLRAKLDAALRAMPERYEWPSDDPDGYYAPSVGQVVDAVLAVVADGLVTQDETILLANVMRKVLAVDIYLNVSEGPIEIANTQSYDWGWGLTVDGKTAITADEAVLLKKILEGPS